MEARVSYGPSESRPRLTVVTDGAAPYSALPHAVLFDTRLSDGAVRLYAVLQSHWWQGGECWASHSTLAEQMGIKERQVRRLTQELLSAEKITERRRGRGQSKAYAPVDSASQQVRNDRLNRSEMTALEPKRSEMSEDEVKNDRFKRSKMTAQYIRSEEDTYSSKKQERDAASAAPAPAEVKPKVKAESRASRLAEDATLTERHLQAASHVGFDAARAEVEWAKFADYHRAKGSRMLDWLAAWRTWLRNAVEFDKRRPASNGAYRAPAAAPEKPKRVGPSWSEVKDTWGGAARRGGPQGKTDGR